MATKRRRKKVSGRRRRRNPGGRSGGASKTATNLAKAAGGGLLGIAGALAARYALYSSYVTSGQTSVSSGQGVQQTTVTSQYEKLAALDLFAGIVIGVAGSYLAPEVGMGALAGAIGVGAMDLYLAAKQGAGVADLETFANPNPLAMPPSSSTTPQTTASAFYNQGPQQLPPYSPQNPIPVSDTIGVGAVDALSAVQFGLA